MRPTTKYAKSGDVHIAYQVVGDGPLDVIFVPGWFSHVEAAWDRPEIASFYEGLASFCRLIVFDKRGTGLSDPIAVKEPPTLEQRMDDVRAVLDAVGSERAALIGLSEGGPMSAVFAATYPDRTSALILTGTFARFPEAPDYPMGADRNVIEAMIEGYVQTWGEGLIIQLAAPSIDTEANRRLTGQFERLAASPGMVGALMRLNMEIDIRPILPSIRVPTLILHRAGDMLVSVEHGRYLAENIPGARLVELAGIDHIPWAGDTEAFLGEVEEFLTGVRHEHEPDRVLSTVMFTDIVGSTERAAEVGDRRWHETLERFYTRSRKEIERFRGRAVKSTGDGVLATFDGPARAIRSARAISDAVGEFGIQIRAGLHTGECEMMGSDVGGIAVHIGARVAALAGPGEVLVSRTVRDLVAGSGLSFVDRGEHSLKGIPGVWQLYGVAN